MTARQAIKWAVETKTIIPAFNVPYLPMMEPIIEAIADGDAIAMVQVARLEWEKFGSESVEAVAEEYHRLKKPGNTLLHLDHVPVIDEDYQRVDVIPIFERAIKSGYQSAMIDASRLPFEENVEATKRAAKVVHEAGLVLEAELGALAGHESGGIGMGYEELFESKRGFTDITEAARFAKESGCDWLSVAAGSVHGAIADNVRKQKKPEARLDISHIAALREAVSGMPMVLHGGSGIKQSFILEAVVNGVAKINVGTEIRQPYESALEEKPGDLGYAKEQVYKRTLWVINDFLKINGNKSKFLGLKEGFA